MTQIGASNERFLRKEYVVPKLFQIMEPYLTFLNILPKVQTDSRSVRYKQETVSASSDTLKKVPPLLATGAKFPRVDITNMSVSSALLNQRGVEVVIDRDAIRFTEGIDVINRAFRKVGYQLAQSQNDNIGSSLTSGVTAGGGNWTPTAVWSSDSATPVDDLIRFEGQVNNQEGYPYMLSDVYVHYTNFTELKGHLTAADIDGIKQREIYGMPNISRDTINIPVVNANVHKMLSGISEGYILGLDLANPAGTIYYNNDPEYSTPSVSYQGSDGVMKTVPNYGFNFNSYQEDDTHSTILQFWCDYTVAIQESKAGLYDSGI